MKNKQIKIVQYEDGQAQVEVRFEKETLWLTKAQMAELFEKDVRTINEHIKNIYAEKELTQSEATIRKFRIVRKEGDRQIKREIDHYNLDMVISVGYRVNSRKGTQFRIWATQRLREYLVNGYALNQQRFEQNAKELEAALALIKKAAHFLYFMVKNHPFTDGNKRSGAFLFVDFLHRNNRLLNEQEQPIINDTGLAALTLYSCRISSRTKRNHDPADYEHAGG